MDDTIQIQPFEVKGFVSFFRQLLESLQLCDARFIGSARRPPIQGQRRAMLHSAIRSEIPAKCPSPEHSRYNRFR
jgi:hypothetical protein